MAIYKPLKPITLVLKHLLHVAKLNDPYLNGLSSYGLILMIVAFFQYLIYNGNYEEMHENYGRLLINFLRHYGGFFDYTNNKIVPTCPNDII